VIAADAILAVLDSCAEAFTFPMLDNGYVYLAATRLALYRSERDWGMTIEVFGFSPRAGLPDIEVATFGSRVRRQKSANDFATSKAFDTYVANNPNNESAFFHPVEAGDWQDAENQEFLASGVHDIVLRSRVIRTPGLGEYPKYGIELIDSPRVRVYELCRLLAAEERDLVLATPTERRVCVPEDLPQIMLLEEWTHPNLVDGELPSATAEFRALAEVLASGNVAAYRHTGAANTHWKHWPGGGML
jgi:hypothetical protein